MWWEEWEKNLNFDNEITKILATQNSCPGEVLEGGVVEREKTNCGNQVVEIVGEWGERK